MTQLMSNIPLLYCLLYYKTGQQLKQTPSFQNHPGSDRFLQPGSFHNTANFATTNKPLADPPWIYHSRRKDLNTLCYNTNVQNSEGSHLPEYSTDGYPVKSLNDVGKLLPRGLTSEQDLHKIILRLNWAGTAQRYQNARQTVARYALNPHVQAALKTEMQGGMHCGNCLTDVGYEVVAEVTDFNGQNHTVINLHNAYQFIPSGKCLNENSSCNGDHARCKQVYRAHWTLVWSSISGVQLVAHEVPSHCECINLGGPPPSGTRSMAGQATDDGDTTVKNVMAQQQGQ